MAFGLYIKKQMKTVLGFFLITLSIFSFQTLKAQDLDKATIKEAITSKRFVFVAQTAFPIGGATRQLTSNFDLRVAGDSLISYLPYFGRAYNPPMPGEGGFRFTSTNFKYSSKAKKKDSWEISLEPTDQRDVRKMILRIFENGSATLQVNSNDRQPISFSGYISLKK
jgi:hypothetical protein